LEIVHRAAACRNVPVTFTLDGTCTHPQPFFGSGIASACSRTQCSAAIRTHLQKAGWLSRQNRAESSFLRSSLRLNGAVESRKPNLPFDVCGRHLVELISPTYA